MVSLNKSNQSYIICTSPRSGSTLLCKLLQSTGNAGNPDSYFHSNSPLDWLKYYELDKRKFSTEQDALRAIFQSVLKEGSSANGVFGLRLQKHSLEYFSDKLKTLVPNMVGAKQRMECIFGNTLFIYLNREDKIAQAISYIKAKQSGLWHIAPDGTELERLSNHKEPAYDHQAIATQLEIFKRYHEEWLNWFNQEKIEPHIITYEDLSANPIPITSHILDLLQLDRTLLKTKELPVAKLADETNVRWAKRFRSEPQDQTKKHRL